MNALLLAAGLGTRLRPLTDHTPKCLVEIAGRPLLDYWLTDLDEAGVEGFVVNTHHLAEKVVAFLERHPLRDRIKIAHEPTLLGTAGTLLANRASLLNDATLVAHADNYCRCDWKNFLESHRYRPAESLMTMMTFVTDSPKDSGIVTIDNRGIVQSFHEKVDNPPGYVANAAVYVIEPAVFAEIDAFGYPVEDLSTEVLPRFLGRISTWPCDGQLIDIGTAERLARARIVEDRIIATDRNTLR